MTDAHHATVPVMTAALLSRCPRCGKGPLFSNLLNLRQQCTSCDLNFGFIDTGDGPAVFAIFILGFFCLGGALIAEFRYGMPVWGHVLMWGVLTPLIAVVLLRFLKALLIALQYRNKAEEGRLSKD